MLSKTTKPVPKSSKKLMEKLDQLQQIFKQVEDKLWNDVKRRPAPLYCCARAARDG